MRNILKSRDEISATEKLLEAIRGESAQTGTPEDDPSPPPQRGIKHQKILGALLSRLFSLKRKILVGVDMRSEDMRLIKLAEVSDHRWKLIAYRCVPFGRHTPDANSAFIDFFRSAVLDFGGSPRNMDLWSLMSSSQMDVRHLRIPRVPRKQIYNVVYWTMKKEASFDEKENIFDFELQGNVVEKGIDKISVMAYTVPGQDAREIRDIFSRSGLKPAGITLAPFAIQNLFRTLWLPATNKPVAALYIGNDFSRIDIFLKGNLVLTRGIKAGINSMEESLMEAVAERRKAPVFTLDDETLTIPINIDKESSPDQNQAKVKETLFDLFAGIHPPAGEDSLPGFGEEEIFDAVQPAIERLVRQVERTFEHYSRTASGEVVSKIYISGDISSWKRLTGYIGNQLGMDREVMDPLSPALLFSSDVPPPDSPAARQSYTAALGLALSDNSRTPNITFTYKDREELASITRVNRGVFAGFMLAVCVLMGIYLWQGQMIRSKKTELEHLRRQLAEYHTVVDQNLIVEMAAKVKAKNQALKDQSREYLGSAVLSDLSSLTPRNIRLVSVTMDLGSVAVAQCKGSAEQGKPSTPAEQAKTSGEPAKTSSRTLLVDGVVLGARDGLEASLAAYLMRLESSPIFVNPTVQSSVVEDRRGEGQMLHFTLKIGLV